MRALWLVAVASLSGCVIPTSRKLTMERERIFIAPGSPQMFSSTSRVEHRETKVVGPELSKHDDGDWLSASDESSDTATRSQFYVLDPGTRAEERIGELRGDGDPVFYDATRKILWVRDSDRILHAISKGTIAGPDEQLQVDVATLEPPFVITVPEQGSRALFDLSSTGVVALPPQIDAARVLVDGKIVRFTVVEEQQGVAQVSQIGVDFSTPTPQRLPDVVWSTPPLPPDVGTRLALTVAGDRYVEVVSDPQQTRLLVYQLVPGSQPRAIPLPPADKNGKLATLDADTVVFGVQDDDTQCWHGETIHLRSGAVVPLPASPCVVGTAITRGRYVLETKDGLAAIVDTAGKLVRLDGVATRDLRAALAITPTTRTLVLEADTNHPALVEVNLETGELHRTPLDQLRPEDRLLGVVGGVARFARGHDTIVSIPLVSAAASIVTLDAPEMTRADRMPSNRTELWAAFGGGPSTNGTGVGGLHVAVAHWVTDRWTAVGGFRAGFEAGPSDEKNWRQYGGSFGYTWHRLPQLWSFNWGADLGASYAAAYLDKKRVDRAFAPSAELHAGWSGSFIGIDLTAVVPSFIDVDRGVQLWATIKFGLTGSDYL